MSKYVKNVHMTVVITRCEVIHSYGVATVPRGERWEGKEREGGGRRGGEGGKVIEREGGEKGDGRMVKEEIGKGGGGREGREKEGRKEGEREGGKREGWREGKGDRGKGVKSQETKITEWF